MFNLNPYITVHEGKTLTQGFSNENSLVQALMAKPAELTRVMTLLGGSWFNSFPLLELTLGQEGGTDSKGISVDNIEYTYKVFGKRKTSERVHSSQYDLNSKPGINLTNAFLVFPKFFVKQATIINSAGQICRIMNEPVPIGSDLARYEVQLITHTPDDFIDPSTCLPGAVWGHNPAGAVGQSLSVGSTHNIQTPGRMKNQLTVLRSSYSLAGTISKKIVELKIPMKGAMVAKYWMDYEEWMHHMTWNEAKNMHYWISKYNRDENGRITTIDESTNQPIPFGMGVDQQITNMDTYTDLTQTKFDNTIGAFFNLTNSSGISDFILFTGKGGLRNFDNMNKKSNLFSLVAQGAASSFITTSKSGLMLGNNFTAYRTIDGHIIRVRELPFLNEGPIAEASGRDGATGLPNSSFNFYLLDAGTYEGQRNLVYVHEEGRYDIRGLQQGMTLLRGTQYADYNGNGKFVNLSTEVDASSLHFMCSGGVQILNPNLCFKLIRAV